jgi:hypothetical protein
MPSALTIRVIGGAVARQFESGALDRWPDLGHEWIDLA